MMLVVKAEQRVIKHMYQALRNDAKPEETCAISAEIVIHGAKRIYPHIDSQDVRDIIAAYIIVGC